MVQYIHFLPDSKNFSKCFPSLHLTTFDDCLENKRKLYQNCSMLYYVNQSYMHTRIGSSDELRLGMLCCPRFTFGVFCMFLYSFYYGQFAFLSVFFVLRIFLPLFRDCLSVPVQVADCK